jgi:membrane protein DedA with SNARE-associated domain
MADMRYRDFLIWNAAGGLCWGIVFTLAGYFAGTSYERVISVAGSASSFIIALVVVGVVAFVVWRKVRERHARTKAD